MSDSSETKRRRVEGPAAATISSLPDVVLQHCFSFVGPGHYRYVAGVSHWFRNVYSVKHPRKTTWKNVAVSVACADLCLEDERELGWNGEPNVGPEEHNLVREIALAAGKSGRVNILKWGHLKGFDLHARAVVDGSVVYSPILRLAAENGHIHVLEWAESNKLNMVLRSFAIARRAARGGQVVVLDWMKDRGMLPTNDYVARNICREAVDNGHLQVLDWLLENDFDHETVKYNAVYHAAARGIVNVLDWAKDQGWVFSTDAESCAFAARHGNLPMVQWLRENKIPWDVRVVRAARANGHENVAAWAIENGCPEPDAINDD